jgi:hypothetical protein
MTLTPSGPAAGDRVLGITFYAGRATDNIGAVSVFRVVALPHLTATIGMVTSTKYRAPAAMAP